MAFHPRNTNIRPLLVPESDSWGPAYEQGKKQQQPFQVASTAADKENVPPPQHRLGGHIQDFTYPPTSSNPTCANGSSLNWQSIFTESFEDRSIIASQNLSSLPTVSTQKMPWKQNTIPFSDSLQGSNLSILGHRAVPTQITGVAIPAEKPVSFAHAVRANLPPPPPKLPAPSYSYASKAEPGGLFYSQFPDKIQTPADFGRAIRDAAKTGSPTEGAKLSERMLRKMIDDFESKRSKYRPDGACFNAVIHAYAEMGDAHAAEHILTLMHQDFEKGNSNAEPNAKIYTNILHAWRKSKSPDAPERCEKILGTMNRLSDTGALPNCKPDAFSYTVAFHCWAESNRNEAAKRADHLFREMESRYMAGESGLQPDAILYSNVINIFTKNATTNHRAEELLWAMVHDFLTGNKFAEPKIRNFNTIMAMWSKSTEDIAPYKAQTIVLRMLEFCKEKILNMAPDSYTYCLLLKTWASSKHPEGISQAVKCLYWMKEQFIEGDEAACPDVIKYTTCISALAKNGNPDRAESLLQEMCEDYLGGNQKAKPNLKLFEIVLNSWTGAYKNDPDPHRAEALLRHMWDLHSSQKFRSICPRSVTYSRIVMSMASNDAPERAEELLFEMDQLCHSQKISEGPTLELLLAVTKAWICSKHEDRHLHIQLLHKLRLERFANV
ncbi:hypothetical protein FisN_19Lh213 [Fistulifera solaris]|uniref:Pentacotripeptide-repeat region of PRORP domain-containing protein n=1 Tax=Fistulifera solaris TaxID=1519565 RepID=A0A1Z5J6W0_FISSO|nr:hypothetical protein FisN_19Lh213 [Fistulifera solaris]|eukprot:GAX09744.1 hypothetical protein FisN_19Lh213 [Fistulifera solaris]